MKELSLQNTRLDNRYDILRLLGRGSYAEIFLARDNNASPDSVHKSVVVKALNVLLQEAPDADLERTLIENFQNEALALDRVRHPNVINRLGHGTARDLRGTIFHYLVLEYLPGGDLSELCRHEPLSFQRTAFYLEQVCAGLQHAHEQGVIHRDIKPQNLLLTEDHETVKIADFGVARFADLDSPITRVGTNVYAAPEHSPAMLTANLTHGAPNFRLTPAADVYSLAKTVYTILCCESPRRFANSPITALPDRFQQKRWANELLKILEKATQINPAERYQTVQDFWEDFVQIKDKFQGDSTLHPSVFTSSLNGFVPQAPKKPSFSSLPNVQTAPAAVAESALPSEQKPRIVVDLDRPVQNQPQTTQTKTAFPNANSNFRPVPVNQTPVAQKFEQIETTARESFGGRIVGFFKRLSVAIFLLTIFAAVLYGTFLYLQSSGMLPVLPSSINIFGAQKATANKDAWLRSAPTMGNNQIGIVTVGSELKIYGKSLDGSWYEVEVVKQGQPDKVTTTALRGWVGKSIVDFN